MSVLEYHYEIGHCESSSVSCEERLTVHNKPLKKNHMQRKQLVM